MPPLSAWNDTIVPDYQTNLTLSNTVWIPGDQAFIDFRLWLVLLILATGALAASLLIERCEDLTGFLASFLWLTVAISALWVTFNTVEVFQVLDPAIGGEALYQTVHVAQLAPFWFPYPFVGMFLLSLLNCYRVAFRNMSRVTRDVI
jgi:hypothetical protein